MEVGAAAFRVNRHLSVHVSRVDGGVGGIVQEYTSLFYVEQGCTVRRLQVLGGQHLLRCSAGDDTSR